MGFTLNIVVVLLLASCNEDGADKTEEVEEGWGVKKHLHPYTQGNL